MIAQDISLQGKCYCIQLFSNYYNSTRDLLNSTLSTRDKFWSVQKVSKWGFRLKGRSHNYKNTPLLQGSVLGHLFFLIYINWLKMGPGMLMLFADENSFSIKQKVI